MKKIISGLKYDTDTAQKMAYWDNNFPGNDFDWYSEILYRKRTGEYFLYGDGNANSKYSTSFGYKSRGGGEAIIPLTLEEAQKWAERLDGEEYEKIFGVVEEERDQVGGFWIERSVKARADALGKKQKEIYLAGVEALEARQS